MATMVAVLMVDSVVFPDRQKTAIRMKRAMRRQAAANYIQSGHYREAMNVLQSLEQRNGQWYYLSSMANMGLGNNVNALERYPGGGAPGTG